MNVKIRIKKSPVKMGGKKTSLVEVTIPNSTVYCFLERKMYSIVKAEPWSILSILNETDMLSVAVRTYMRTDKGFILNKKKYYNEDIQKLLD